MVGLPCWSFVAVMAFIRLLCQLTNDISSPYSSMKWVYTWVIKKRFWQSTMGRCYLLNVDLFWKLVATRYGIRDWYPAPSWASPFQRSSSGFSFLNLVWTLSSFMRWFDHWTKLLHGSLLPWNPRTQCFYLLLQHTKDDTDNDFCFVMLEGNHKDTIYCPHDKTSW